MRRIQPAIRKPSCWRDLLLLIFCIVFFQPVAGQTSIDLTDLSAFRNPGKSWRMAGSVTADLEKPNILNVAPGSGILVNLPDKKNHGVDLVSNAEYGDMDLELDFMMAKGSNSGIYLHGRYELQLMDSWTLKGATSGSNGGIYERWDESRPEGNKGYEGHAPRQNASRAPGLWQHMKISFRAPRFNQTGEKIEDAKIVRVELNGALIHEDVELSGPTRGGMGRENATGPLRLQGDHGAVAFRNIKVTDFGAARPEETETNRYRVYPIMVEASASPVFRSFMDLPGGIRVVHAVSASSEEKVHYTYDTDTGMIIQVWRGDYLDATPMWHSRGDGSSRPVGAVQTLGNPAPAVTRLASLTSPWKTDTLGTGFRPKGYVLDQDDNPVFHYRVNGVMVSDATQALENGEGISREITVSAPSEKLYFRLAEGETIVSLQKGLYMIDNNSYYLKVEDTGGAQPLIRNSNGKKELIVPIAGKLKYAILF
jgi:hypothetical protein